MHMDKKVQKMRKVVSVGMVCMFQKRKNWLLGQIVFENKIIYTHIYIYIIRNKKYVKIL